MEPTPAESTSPRSFQNPGCSLAARGLSAPEQQNIPTEVCENHQRAAEPEVKFSITPSVRLRMTTVTGDLEGGEKSDSVSRDAERSSLK